MANAPYGYKKVTVDRKPTLEIYEPEAKFVRMMFQLYAQGYGCVSIARHINALGARPHRSAEFNRSTVSRILHSPVYVGKIVWNQKKHIKKGVRGNDKNVVIYQPKEKWTIVDGRHPPIVENELFEQVQAILEKRYIPSKNDGTIKSPLAGLVKCANCGMNMQRLVMKKEPYLLCNRPGCCAATRFSLVEERVLEYLEQTLEQLTLSPGAGLTGQDTSVLETTLETVRKELAATQRQKSRLYELLELGEYDIPTFRERMEAVRSKQASLERKEADTLCALQDAKEADPSTLAVKIKYVLEHYQESTAAQRNALLHSVIQTVYYHKEKKTKPTAFYLDFVMVPN